MDEVEEIQETKYLEAFIEKDSGGTLTAVASTNTVDRHGEIVDNNGWDLKAYKKNPVVLWGHDHNEPAIGVSKKTWVEGTGKKAQLMIQPVFHDVTEKARAVKTLVEMGVTKTLSVGFRPLESPDGTTFTKNELLEVSVVNVPANADAMMMAYKGLKQAGIEDETISDLGIEVEEEETPEDLNTNGQKALAEVEQLRQELAEVKEEVKALTTVNPRQRLSMYKVIAKASDKILEAENKGSKVDHRTLTKTIKKATELLTVAEKEILHNG